VPPVFGKEKNIEADLFTNRGETGLFLWGQYKKKGESGL